VLVLLARCSSPLHHKASSLVRAEILAACGEGGFSISITESDAIDAPSANLETLGLIRATLSNRPGSRRQTRRLDRSSGAAVCLRGGAPLYVVLLVPLVGELLLRLESLSQSGNDFQITS
jgi:hypothetical protein